MMSVPRSEYPRPQFVRERWLCLNGAWQFEIDSGDSGKDRGLLERELGGEIIVPFCPESSLSGVGSLDFLNAVWYRRKVRIPADWDGSRVLLNFQAVDYDATVWVNGSEVGRHRGGWTGFSCDLSTVAKAGEEVTIVVRARDLKHMAGRPGGKQSNHQYHNAGCHYPRTTGIWQTVWMEPVNAGAYLLRPRITPDVAGGRFIVTMPILAQGARREGYRVKAVLKMDGRVIAEAGTRADLDMSPMVELAIAENDRRLWSIENPFLYDLDLELVDGAGKVVDRATSYAGLRSVCVDGQLVLINGKSVFQRLVLDQGFYPDGILTAPSDEALVKDIRLSQEAGFNGARLHQKVFEERFLYHADRMGYLCWGEFGDWGVDKANPLSHNVAQWLEALHRDYNHPAIIGWCGLNETWESITDVISPLNDLTQAFYLAAKAMDPTRPVLDASGYSHRVYETDIFDCHDYDQKPDTFRARHAETVNGKVHYNEGWRADMGKNWSLPYRGQPFMVSEFGGTWWNPKIKEGDPSWGYGERPKTVEEVYERFEKLCAALLENPGHFGYCYTQLTDVYQEQNGIYFFDRSAKFDMKRIAAAQRKKAAIE